MISLKHLLFSFFVLLFMKCKTVNEKIPVSDSEFKVETISKKSAISDTTFVSLKAMSTDFVFDMKYATNDNFLKQAVYDCPECYLRQKTVVALIEANKEFISLGYRIKIFDCYRPLSIQKKMWKIVPNPVYVADPTKGSIHNRGCAVDITLVDATGKELDMGTPFDFFGEASSHNYTNVTDEVKKNRQLLKDVMLKHNFKSFDSEWWHYNLNGGNLEKLANFNWECN